MESRAARVVGVRRGWHFLGLLHPQLFRVLALNLHEQILSTPGETGEFEAKTNKRKEFFPHPSLLLTVTANIVLGLAG